MKINVTKDFNYFFSIRDHGQGRTLTVYSQFLGAKNPEEYQYKTQITLQPEDWNRVAEIIRSDTGQQTTHEPRTPLRTLAPLSGDPK
jgi:hypothetical protein